MRGCKVAYLLKKKGRVPLKGSSKISGSRLEQGEYRVSLGHLLLGSKAALKGEWGHIKRPRSWCERALTGTPETVGASNGIITIVGYDTSNNKTSPHESIVIIRQGRGRGQEQGLFLIEHQLIHLENL